MRAAPVDQPGEFGNDRVASPLFLCFCSMFDCKSARRGPSANSAVETRIAP